MNLMEVFVTMQSIIYFVMVASLKHLQVSGERTLNAKADESAKTNTPCNDSFINQINSCMNPFASHAELYTTIKPQNPLVYKIFIKYICRRYEKMLLCVHTVLSNCPSMNNVKIVQNKLSISWALEINQLCNIHTNPMDTDGNKTKNDHSTETTVQDNKLEMDKGSLQRDYSGLLLPHDLESKRFRSDTIPQTNKLNDGNNINSLSPTKDDVDYNEKNINDIEEDYNILRSDDEKIEIITNVIKYKPRPRNQLWTFTQHIQVPLKSKTIFAKKFSRQKNKPVLLELLYISVNRNLDLNHLPKRVSSVLKQTSFQTASTAKSVILQTHMSWQTLLLLALVNILFCLYRSNLW